jgi:hypothetical protein
VKVVLVREVIEKGAIHRWKLISATKEPGADVILVTWDTFPRTRVNKRLELPNLSKANLTGNRSPL